MWRYVGLVALLLLAVALVPMAVRSANERPVAQPMTPLTPTSDSPVTVFIGDSSVAGAGATRSSGRWSSVASKQLNWQENNEAHAGSGYGPTTTAGGCDGRSTCQAYAEEIDAVKKLNPQVIVVGGGHPATTTARTTAPVTSFYKALHTALPDAHIIAVGPWTAGPRDDKAVVALDQAVQASARSVNAVYVSLLGPELLNSSMTTDHGKSLNDIGHQQVADQVVSTINAGDN